MLNAVTSLNQTPICSLVCLREWIPKRHDSLKEIGLCAQNMINILGSIVNIIRGDLYDNLVSTRIPYFDNE